MAYRTRTSECLARRGLWKAETLRAILILLTVVACAPLSSLALLGESEAEIERKMGPPIKRDVRPHTDFPQRTYGLVYTGRGWRPISSIQKKEEEATLHNRKWELQQIEHWLKETWGVQVVYIDNKSMCEAWIPLDHKVTRDHARLILSLYRGDKEWKMMEEDKARKLSDKFQMDLSGRAGKGSPVYIFRPEDESQHFIIYETHISVFAEGYTDRIRPARIVGEKEEKQTDDAFLQRA